MKLSEIKYNGPKIDNATKLSIYALIDHTIFGIIYTGSFRSCWIRRAYIAQYDNIQNYEIVLSGEVIK
jgi:hypothetical protein